MIEVKPVETLKEFKVLQTKVNNFVVSAKAWRVAGGMAGGAILWLLIQVPNWIKLLMK